MTEIIGVAESFDSFVARLSSEASRDGIARGVAIEPYCGVQGALPENASDKHILTMCSKHSSRFEIRDGLDRWASYTKQPGSLSLIPAGARPTVRAETEFDLVVCALDSALVSGLDSELERRPEGELRLKANFQDPAAQKLMTLLIADANEGHTTERLYTEHLAQALAVRVLFFARGTKPPSNNGRTYGLPGH